MDVGAASVHSRWEAGVVRMVGFQRRVSREAMWWVLVVLSGGLAALVAYWRPDWELRARRVRSGIGQSDFVLVVRNDGAVAVETVECATVRAATPLTRRLAAAACATWCTAICGI